MSDLPAPIRAYLDTHIIANRYPAYLLVDKAGGLTEWGGRLEAYGIADLQKGKDVGEQLFFLVGLLPLHGRSLFLSGVETESHGAIDLYIFPGDEGDWVLLLDATAEILRLRSLRQKEHDLHLLQEGRAKEASQPGFQDAALEVELFAALDVLVLERVANGVFRPVGTTPDWCRHLYPEAAAGQDKLQPGEKFLFLENFLIDAEQHWRNNPIGYLKSGLWTELDLSGHERHLEAVALQLGDRKILFVKLLGVVYEERQQIIQTGRGKSLAYERLARVTEALRHSEAALQESERRHRRLAEALRTTHDELEQKVAERTAELERANQVKDDFVGTMSHELRTPLNIILGYNDLLLEGEFGNLEPEQLRVVQRVDKSARELVDLVTTTLDLSRLQSQQLPLSLQEVQVAGLVEEVLTDIRYLNPKPALSLRWETAPNLPLLRTDPLKLRVVLKNLITNAVKFTDQGSVSLTAQRKGAGIEFCVTDTGISIAPEALSVIFEPFRQLNNSTTRLHSGVGLGLYIVCQLLDLLEGTISVDSEVGKGSAFRVWLPLVAKRT